MFSTKRGIVFLAIIFGLAGLFQIGCNRNGSENPVAAPIYGTDSATNNANVSFKLVFPQKDSAIQSANIMPSMNTGAVVTFQIKLLNYGNTSNPFFIISKQVPVVNGSASAIFESLPTTTILGQIHIENGKIQGYSDFHGALDLIQGENTVTLAPVGSLMPQDVVAKALSEIISSSTLFLSAPQSLVSELNNIVSVLLLDSSAVYNEVINNFTNRNGLPVVELVSPTTNQTFVAGDNIAIIASATDMDGSIAKVEFFQGTNKVGEALALPFFCTWKPLSAGYYSLTAKAFDNNSAVGVTSPVIIQVISKETPAGYTVTYNGNGNTGGSVPTDNLAYQQNATVTVKDNAGSLVKTGYTFAGWNTAADGSGTSYNPAATFTMGSANVTLYAKWSLVPAYTVTYNGNGNTGGSVPADNLTYQQSATVTVKDNTGSLVKTGYTFAGWNTSGDGSGTSYNPAATFTMGSANVTLYAKWSLVPAYTVTYNGNGNTGGSVPTDNLTYQQGATVTVKDNTGSLVKTGYTFAGWNTKSDGSGQDYLANSTFLISGDIVLYAKWQSSLYSWSPGSVTVSDTNFALGRPTATYTGTSYSSESAVDGNPMTRWSGNRDDLGPDESNPHFLIVDLQQTREVRSIKVNIAGWDSWKQNFSIYTSADLQSWSLVASEQDKTGILSYNLQPINIRYVKFSSTYSADNGQVNLYELEVYGTEQAVNTYTVTYNGNGNTSGSVPTDGLTYQQSATVTVQDNAGNLVKTGYTFAGWNTAADGSGTSYNPAATFSMGPANVTLFAKWSLVPTYTVTYNGNGNTGGTVTTDNQAYQQGAIVTAKDNAGNLTKTGYAFAGWNTAADGSGTNYNPNAIFVIDAVNVTLYAKWYLLIDPHNVNYDGNGANSGHCPIDSNLYEANTSVVVLPNSGNLGKTGYTFDCWNTKADGSGFSYVAGSTLAMSAADLILYAKWRSNIPTWVYSSISKSEVNYALGRPSASNSSTEPCYNAVDGSNDTRWSSNRADFGPDEANPHFLIVDLEQERDIKMVKVNIAGWDSYEQSFSIQISSDLENWVTVACEEDKTGIRTYFVTKTARYVKFVSTYSADNGQVNLYELEVYGEIPTTYGVSYNGNGHTGGEIPTDVKSYVENDTVDVKDAASLVKDGCSFVCWNTSPDGFGANYFGSSNFNIGNSDVTLFAKWSSEAPTTIVSVNIGNLVGVPSGAFHLDNSDENIAYVSAFRMSKCEITQAQFVEITGLPNPSSFTTGSNLPVNRTSWYQTLVFCNKLSLLEGLEPAYIINHSTNPDDWGSVPTNYNVSWDNVSCNWAANGYRLPTETEWLWAAMGATDDLSKPFSGNGSLSDCVWYEGNSGGTTHVVGTKLPNSLGLYDMSGNVREWCWDWAGNYPLGANVDYRGPTNGTYRIARGDSYADGDGWLYLSQRDLDVPYYPRSNLGTLGFRVVRR